MDVSDEILDEMRTIGDPLVDSLLVERLAYSPSGPGPLLGELFRSGTMPEEHPVVSAYLRSLPEVDVSDPRIERGQRLFELFGPEILLTLGACSLPLAFACGNGAQVIYRARRLKDDALRRLCDTAQMVINVMQPRQLVTGSLGWRSAAKVRLIHALIRRHVQSSGMSPWNSSWGSPINQEDQAGTLLSFSVAALRGLRKMGAKIDQDDADAYVFAWSAVGRLLGVDHSVLPVNESDAAMLAGRIGKRQVRSTPEGKELAEQSMKALEELIPINGYANSLTHFFLQDTPFGEKVGSTLQLPEPNWTRSLVALRAAHKRVVLALLPFVPGARSRRSRVARNLLQAMILLKRPKDDRMPFEVPDGWIKKWRLFTKNARSEE